ncbi:glycosyltransferase involved in cell wall biosynthesis [Flavobacterium nitrogenifigens]|uniref:Glycosyltransferase involved in cell wall biosynthesis n=2 Tax=Flavobacterium TaxID=237 RepID=A0A7W7J1A2_9FLAO|nr:MULTISPECIES: glycosyltransferase [Flavobacterium]MBB4803655.1 glycosyltransferase involved in cell wall biosynthesis [Flavobacterium nitrogenifigens]MBB6388540.1 glycosyltransferase involved in cell wall biosynthesis [Flavobacterium notoginsengisoli]
MISLIICSRSKDISHNLNENIQTTVGCEYELIVIDNSANQYSIFEAYNFGLKKSRYDFVCFLHDDILIHSSNWGELLVETFRENKEIGLIGVAGSLIKTKMPSGWWNSPQEKKAIHLIQHSNKLVEKWDYGFENNSWIEVAAIDGVFMMMRKDANIQFNSKMKGFHNYDLNISFEYRKNGYKVMVTNKILVEHFSIGTINKDWVDSTFKVHKIYKNILPLVIGDFSIQDLKSLEFENGVKYVNHALNYNLKKNAISIWISLLPFKIYSLVYYKFLKKLVRLTFKSR